MTKHATLDIIFVLKINATYTSAMTITLLHEKSKFIARQLTSRKLYEEYLSGMLHNTRHVKKT
jgi:hypothetical protein